MTIIASQDYPKLSETKAIFFVALSMIIMALGFIIPIIPLILFFAIWLSHAYYQKTLILKPSYTLLPLCSFGALCMFSVFWSDFPDKTLYYSVMFCAVLLSSIIASRIIEFDALIKGCIVGLTIVLLITIASGRYEVVYATGQPALVGFFGQKNGVGAVSAIGLFLSFLFFFYCKSAKEKLFYAVIPAILALICLHLSLSKTSWLGAAGAFGILAIAFFLHFFPARLRLLVLSLLSLFAGAVWLLIIGFDIDLVAFVLEAMDKNPTLTGRTLIWQNGIERALEKPFLGYGYSGFWQDGNPWADYYLKLYDAEHTFGFHFHNLYLQSFVNLGIFGLSFTILLFLFCFCKTVALVCKHGMLMQVSFPLGIAGLYFVRSIAEVELLGPTGITTFIFYVFFQKLIEYKPHENG